MGNAVKDWPTKRGKGLFKKVMKALEPGFGEYLQRDAGSASLGNTFVSISGGEGYSPADIDYIVESIKDSLHEPIGYRATGDVKVIRLPGCIIVQALTRGLQFTIQFRSNSPYYFSWTEVAEALKEKFPGCFDEG